MKKKYRMKTCEIGLDDRNIECERIIELEEIQEPETEITLAEKLRQDESIFIHGGYDAVAEVAEAHYKKKFDEATRDIGCTWKSVRKELFGDKQ